MKNIPFIFTPYLLVTLTLMSINSFSQSIADYTISLTTIWNSTDHTTVPTNAHWSALVGATHKNPNDIVDLTTTAPTTNGIKDVAEKGINTNFSNEIDDAITIGNADKYIEEPFTSGAIATATLNNISINENFPLITLISMVAPSSDWFIAVTNENLRSGLTTNNGWKSTYTIDVFAYDAGTSEGTDYSFSDIESSPRVAISKITSAPINGNKMGTITFTYNASTLSTNTPNSIDTIKLFPNPSKGNLVISNIQNINLKTIEIYNVMGKMVKQISISKNSTRIDLDVSDINSGIYLLKLNTINELSKTYKIAINP